MLLTIAALLLVPQTDCTASAQDNWLTPIAPGGDLARAIHVQRVLPVQDGKIADAIAYVSVLPFKPLTDTEAASLTGRTATGDTLLDEAIAHADSDAENDGFASPEEAVAEANRLRHKLSPYLVRAVFPTPNAVAGATWYGDTLAVAAGGMGCAPYAKHPVVIWLDKMPHRIEVSASAVL